MRYKSSWINWRIAIVDSRELSFGAKAVGLYLNTYMNDRQDCAWPAITTICGEMSTTKKTVVKYLAELEIAGFVVKEKRFSKSTVYHAAIPRSVESTLVEDLHLRSVESTPVPVETLHPNKQGNKQRNKQDKAKRFVPPTLVQVEEYKSERGLNINPEQFINYYESNGWMVGRTKMKDWKAAARGWSQREGTNGTRKQANRPAESHHAGVVKMLRSRIAADSGT